MHATAESTGQKDRVSSKEISMFSRLVLALMFCAAYALSASANVYEPVREPGIDIEELDKRASQLMHQLEMVGLSVAVVEEGHMTWAKGYGDIQRDSNRLVTADTVFRWASVSKGVAAATVLSLQARSWARPHGRHGNRVNRVKETYYRVPAAAGVNCSVKDLAKWMIAQMPASEKLPETILSDMQTPRVQTPREQRFLNRRYRALENAHYGLGWRVYDYAGHKVVGHRGGVQGYRALVLFDPEKRSGIAMMWNSPHSRPIGLQLEFMDQLYGLQKRDWLRLNKKI